VCCFEVEFQVAHLGDAHGVLDGFGDVLELGPHLVGRLHVEVGAVVESRLVERGVGADAHEDFVHRVVAGLL
jgi:hypothetical protein